MASTGSRTLQLLSLLQNRRYWPGGELADRLGVSVRTLRRDVDRLRVMGYPVKARRGVDGGYQLSAGAALPPLVLDDDEAIALAVGLQSAVQAGTVTGIEESSVRALGKVVQVMPSRLRRRVDALTAMTVPGAAWSGGPGGATPAVDPGTLTTVAQACRDCERLEFTYTARESGATERHVDPHRLVLLGRRWYLVAFDLVRFDWRTFRLDRLEGPRATGGHFPARTLPGGDAAEFVRAAIDQVPTRHRIEAVVHAPAADVRARIGSWGTVEERDGDRCSVVLSSEELDWPVLVLASTGAEFEVVAPSAMIAHLTDLIGRFGRAVRAGPPR